MTKRIEKQYNTSSSFVRIDTQTGNVDLAGNGDQDRRAGQQLRILASADVHLKFTDDESDAVTVADANGILIKANTPVIMDIDASKYPVVHGITASSTSDVDFNWVG